MAFSTTEWQVLIKALRTVQDVELACGAAQRLHKESTLSDVPLLMQLLHDDDAFVREAAAWPISELVGLPVLRDLLISYQRGFDEGLDNDGFTAALLDLVQQETDAAVSVLQSLAGDENLKLRENARWLLDFCAPKSR
jgi:hypothetical protein